MVENCKIKSIFKNLYPMRPSLVPILIGLAGAPAYAEDAPPKVPVMDLSRMAEVLPADLSLRPVVTVAISRVAGLGLPLTLRVDEKPGDVRFEGVPNDQVNKVADAVNGTPVMNGSGCVAFLIVPDTTLPPSEYTGPYEMGAHCAPTTEIYPPFGGK